LTLVVVAYDVNTQSTAGRRRLRRIAKICCSYGQRVQNSIFECWVDPVIWLKLRAAVLAEYDEEKDSVRFYHLGDGWSGRIEHHGAKVSYDPVGPLIV
jgi:CRISPR-associated protein Cas2